MKKLIRTNEGTDQDKWRNWSEQIKKLIRRVCLKTSFKGEWVNHVSQEALVKFFVNFLVAPTHCVHLKKVNFEAMHPKPYRSGGIRLRNNYIWPPCFWKFTWCCTDENRLKISKQQMVPADEEGKIKNCFQPKDRTRKDQLVFSNRSPWFLLMMTRRKNVQRWQTEWYGKKNKSHCGKNRPKNWPWKARSVAFSILSWTKW